MGTEDAWRDYRARPWGVGRDDRARPTRALDTNHRKLELPIFQGDDIHGWLHRAERYFSINGLDDYDKLDAASICFEGKALHWYRWREGLIPFRGWEELKAEMSKRFRGQPGRVHEEFFALAQDSTVEAYRENFERLSAGLGAMPPEALVGSFMKGLKASIREGVRVHRPRTLDEAMHLAQLVEEEKQADRAAKAPAQSSRTTVGNSTSGEPRDRPRAPAPAAPGTRRMTEADITARKSQGLCLRCDERWYPGHRCTTPRLQILYIDERDEGNLELNQEYKSPEEVTLSSLVAELENDVDPRAKWGGLEASAGNEGPEGAEPEWLAISVPTWLDWASLDADNQDPTLQPMRDAATDSDSRYEIMGTRLFYNGRFVLPSSSKQIPKLLREFHASHVGGHSGMIKTYQRLATEFWWEGMRADVSKFVSECEPCQRSKYEAMRPAGLLQPLELPEQVWAEVTMDFIEGLPKVDGYSVILVVVDRLSKYAHFVPISHPYTAKEVAEIFIKEIIRLHGIPEVLISDRDAIFISNFWKKLFGSLGTDLRRSTAYHPQTDGQTEVVNRSIGTYLRCFASEEQRKWVKLLPWAEYWYNTSYHTATKTTPFKALYGRDPPKIVPHEIGSTPLQHVEQVLVDRDQALKELKRHLRQSQQTMKRQADERRRDVKYKLGDYVYVRLQPGRQITVARRDNYKLAPKYYGPYEVVQRIGPVAYKLKMPRESQIHPVFHVSQLKLARTPPGPNHIKQLKWFPGYQPRYEPEALRGTRMLEERQEVLIKWTRMPEEDATWEPMEYVNEQFPDFNLEDKVAHWEGSNVGNPAHEDHAPTRTLHKIQQARTKAALQVLFGAEATQAPAIGVLHAPTALKHGPPSQVQQALPPKTPAPLDKTRSSQAQGTTQRLSSRPGSSYMNEVALPLDFIKELALPFDHIKEHGAVGGMKSSSLVKGAVGEALLFDPKE